jgi:hypothetical protein
VLSLNVLAGGPIAVADEFDSIDGHLWAYQNRELLALNADGFVGQPFSNDPSDEKSQLWKGQLTSGEWVVGLFNREEKPLKRGIDFARDLGLKEKAQARDLWKHLDLGAMGSFQAEIPPHGCVVLKVSSKK